VQKVIDGVPRDCDRVLQVTVENMANGMTDFEQAALDKLLAGDDPRLAALRTQANVARLISREESGAGFFCSFEVPEGTPKLSSTPDFEVGDVDVTMDGLEHGAGVLLLVRDGYTTTLEGYSYEEPWPSEVKNFKLAYRGQQRQLSMKSSS